MQVLEIELEQRWSTMFAALASGDDVPPSRRLRAEGMMEAAVLLGIATADELLQSMNHCYQGAFDQSIAVAFGDDWQELFPFPQIPAMARRAPVYPSAPAT
jgi:hypothetical protein